MKINFETSFPVMLSLIRLHWKAFSATVWRQKSPVALLSSYAGGSGGEGGVGGGGGYTEAEEKMVRMQGEGNVDVDHHDKDHDEGYDDGEILGDSNLPETYDLRGRKQQQQQQQPQQQRPQQQRPQQHQQQHQHQQQRRAENEQDTNSESNGAGGIS
ncbi:unnamed protein product [Sympodiomycopsis kandeliae]